MHAPRDLKSMWGILDMPEPVVLAAKELGLTGPVGTWPRTLRRGVSWTFQKTVKDVGAWYISPASQYMLVVHNA